MSPRQRLTPRCSAKPARHPAHPDVDPHAVFKRQLPLRLKMMPVRHTGRGGRKHRVLSQVSLSSLDANFDAVTPNFDVNVLLFTSREGPNQPTTPHIDILMTILIKMLTIKMISQSEGKNQWSFNCFYRPWLINF